MADNNNQDIPSASVPTPADVNVNYTYRGMADPNLRYPGKPLPGYKSPIDMQAERAAAARAWQAEQDYQTKKYAATRRMEQTGVGRGSGNAPKPRVVGKKGK